MTPHRAIIACTALGIAASASPLRAQLPAAGPARWEVAAGVGAGFRSERGRTLVGVRLEGGVRRPLGSAGDSWVEFGAGYAQVTAHLGAKGDGPDVKENSFEFVSRVERALVGNGAWRLTGAAGPVASVSSGCAAGGSSGTTYGDASCTNDFAKKGNVRIGGAARLTSEWRGSKAAFVAGAELSAGTIAAGNAASLAIIVGFRAALH